MFADFIRHHLAVSFQRWDSSWPALAEKMLEKDASVIKTDLARKNISLSVGVSLSSGIVPFLEIDSAVEAVILYRIQRAIFLEDPQHLSLAFLARLLKLRTGMELYYSTEIGPGFMVEHGVGTVIGPRHKIGRNFTIHQGVTLGQRRMYVPEEFITIGDDCVIFAGAKLLGKIVIEDNVRIGANAVLLTDAEPNSTYLGVPARKHRSP